MLVKISSDNQNLERVCAEINVALESYHCKVADSYRVNYDKLVASIKFFDDLLAKLGKKEKIDILNQTLEEIDAMIRNENFKNYNFAELNVNTHINHYSTVYHFFFYRKQIKLLEEVKLPPKAEANLSKEELNNLKHSVVRINLRLEGVWAQERVDLSVQTYEEVAALFTKLKMEKLSKYHANNFLIAQVCMLHSLIKCERYPKKINYSFINEMLKCFTPECNNNEEPLITPINHTKH